MANELANSEFVQENKVLNERIVKLEYELTTQKNVTKHFEGIAHILMAELKKVQWVEGKSKSKRLEVLFSQFNDEMKGFLDDKQQLLARFGRIENLYHSICAILK